MHRASGDGKGWIAMMAVGALAAGLACCRAAPAQEVNLAGMQVWSVEYRQTTSQGDYYGPNYNITKLLTSRQARK